MQNFMAGIKLTIEASEFDPQLTRMIAGETLHIQLIQGLGPLLWITIPSNVEARARGRANGPLRSEILRPYAIALAALHDKPHSKRPRLK